jgi:hypothetical protein
MITAESVQTLIGSTAYGPDGDKLGTVGQVYLDNQSDQPAWVTVKTGLFGVRESFRRWPRPNSARTACGCRTSRTASGVRPVSTPMASTGSHEYDRSGMRRCADTRQERLDPATEPENAPNVGRRL